MRAEESEQICVVNYIRIKYPNTLFNISPVNCINPRQGMKNKSMGAQKGCPDLMIFQPNKQYSGLFIELKREEKRDFEGKIYQKCGILSKEQIEYISRLNIAGYKAVVCYGSQNAIDCIDKYFKE